MRFNIAKSASSAGTLMARTFGRIWWPKAKPGPLHTAKCQSACGGGCSKVELGKLGSQTCHILMKTHSRIQKLSETVRDYAYLILTS